MAKHTQLILFGSLLCVLLICVFVPKGVPISDLVEEHNSMAIEYNIAVESYNESITVATENNNALAIVIDNANMVLNTEKIPYDATEITSLEQAIQNAIAARVSIPEMLPQRELLEIPTNATASEISNLRAAALAGIEDIRNLEVPDPITIPDYAPVIDGLQTATEAYECSVMVQEQITAPTDQFILERLKEIDTVLSLAAVTPSNDPNGLLGTEGGYIGCVYFSDSGVDKTQLGLNPNEYDVITMGTVGGGAIEIYVTAEDAETRNAYLTQYDGTSLDSGSHTVLGTMVIRISSKLSKGQQIDLTNQITSILIRIDEQ